jgi:hypothetical protein
MERGRGFGKGGGEVIDMPVRGKRTAQTSDFESKCRKIYSLQRVSTYFLALALTNSSAIESRRNEIHHSLTKA